MDLPVSCTCGAVSGAVSSYSTQGTNRGVCYCRDCRAATRWWKRGDLLDAHGGIDIFQVAQGQLVVHTGIDRLATIRLSPKGLWRAYATCCNTPFGNTLSAGVPFVGLPAATVASELRHHLPASVPFHERSALSPVPDVHRWQQVKMFAHISRLLLSWKLRGMARPSIYFDERGLPRLPTYVLTLEERTRASDPKHT